MSELEKFKAPPKEMKTALSHWIAKRDGWLARSESAPTRESLHAEWMAQEEFLDWSNFLLHKLTGEAESPAPGGCPQCGSVNRDYCNPECSNISTRNEWHRLAAPAPTEEK